MVLCQIREVSLQERGGNLRKSTGTEALDEPLGFSVVGVQGALSAAFLDQVGAIVRGPEFNDGGAQGDRVIHR